MLYSSSVLRRSRCRWPTVLNSGYAATTSSGFVALVVVMMSDSRGAVLARGGGRGAPPGGAAAARPGAGPAGRSEARYRHGDGLRLSRLPQVEPCGSVSHRAKPDDAEPGRAANYCRENH